MPPISEVGITIGSTLKPLQTVISVKIVVVTELGSGGEQMVDPGRVPNTVLSHCRNGSRKPRQRRAHKT